MNNYANYHVEQYGHGTAESNSLPESQKVTISDNDGYFDVYECESESEAQKIADWYLDAVFGSYPASLQIVRHNPRYFGVIDGNEESYFYEDSEYFQVSYEEDAACIFMDFYANYEEASEQANRLLSEGKTPTISVYMGGSCGGSCTEILEREDWAENLTAKG
jgi:hypothetical protein